MAEKVEINGKYFSKRTLEILAGVKSYHKVDNNLLLIAEAIDNPYDFPFLLENIYDMDIDEDLRLALARVQIDSKLHMRNDLEKMQLRLYVSETIEKMLFGELLLDGNGHMREKDEDEKKKDSKKSKKKSVPKSKESSSTRTYQKKDKGNKKGNGKDSGKGKKKSSDEKIDYSYGNIYEQ